MLATLPQTPLWKTVLLDSEQDLTPKYYFKPPKALVDTLEHLGSPSSRIARNSVYLFIELA